MPSLRETRLHSRVQELLDQRSRLTQVLTALQKEADFETRADEKLRLRDRIDELETQRQTVDADLLKLENELSGLNRTAPPATIGPATGSLDLFYCYARRDAALLDELQVFLKPLQREGLIKTWHDRDISPGTEWVGQIDRNLETAHIILLLVSPDFMASDYIQDIELQRAMARHEANSARVIPLLLRQTDWSTAPFSKLQALPGNGIPVRNWSDRDAAFTDIARGIRNVIQELMRPS